MAKRSLPVRLFRFVVFCVLTWIVVTVALVLALRWADPPASAFMIRESIATKPPRYKWVDWQDISASAKVAVIASEDQTFPTHRGFDLKSIDQAFQERGRRQRVRGASTISQQVAKNLFLWSGRSWVRKGLEAYFTVLIEVLWPKQRILEMYLNIAEFGRGIYGIGVASEAFFRKPAAKISTAEAALLAAVLPNPKRLLANKPSQYVRSRQSWIQGQMRGIGGSEVLRTL